MSLWDRTKSSPDAGLAGISQRPNRRAAERKRQRLIDGFVTSDRLKTRPCKICDMSKTGSRIEVWGDVPLLAGDRVKLFIPSDGKEIDARVVWRKATALGLHFTSPFRAPTRAYR